MRRISQTADTNRNSFYYHYDSLEDLARKAFQDKYRRHTTARVVAACWLPE